MKPEMLPYVAAASPAVQSKLAQASTEMKTLQQSSTMMTSSSTFVSSSTSSSTSCAMQSASTEMNSNFLSTKSSSSSSSTTSMMSEMTQNHFSSKINGTSHQQLSFSSQNGSTSIQTEKQMSTTNGHETLESIISQGTETVRALTEAIVRDDQEQFSLSGKEDKQQSILMDKSDSVVSLFKSKYEDKSNKPEPKGISHRARSVGAGTPDRESRRPSFSYLSLLPADGSFPHRTQAIGGPQTSRKTSTANSAAGSRAPSVERAASEKPNLMIRTHPIGLAEPHVKRDGYAVGKDGSFYRSSENLFTENTSRNGSRANSEAPSEQPRTWRRTSDTGIRTGGGLIEPGRAPVTHFFAPFGSTATGKNKNFTVKKGNGSSLSRKSSMNSSSTTTSSTSSTSLQTTNVQTSSVTSKMTTTTMTSEQSASKDESTVVNCTVNLKRRHRSQSACRANVTLPDRDVTISLPGSLRASVDREIVEPSLARSGRSSSVEIFNGVYEVKVPGRRSAAGAQAEVAEIYSDHVILRGRNDNNNVISSTSNINSIGHNNLNGHCSVEVDEGEAPHTEVILTGIPLRRSTLAGSTSKNGTGNGITSTTTTTSTSSLMSSTKLVMEQESKMQMSSTMTRQNFVSQQNSMSQTELLRIEQKKQEEAKREEQRKLREKREQEEIEKREKERKEKEEKERQKREEEKRLEKERKLLEERQIQQQRETVVTGQKFNISTSLKKTSRLSSREDLSVTRDVVREVGTQSVEVGDHLRGLNLALEALLVHNGSSSTLTKEKRSTSTTITTSADNNDVTTVTVSLPASRRSSRRGSVDLGSGGGGRRTRRNSIDLYTAEYDVKLATTKRDGTSTPLTMEAKNVCHIRIDDREKSSLKLCPRCHGVGHSVSACTEFGDMSCPRCLEWNHWEDSCPATDDLCDMCNVEGHLQVVHGATDYKQRRAIVDTLGWELFRDWFYELSFRSWWQLNGCLGVPLYKIYKRKNVWRTEGPLTEPTITDERELDKYSSYRSSSTDGSATNGNLSLEERASQLSEKYSTNYKVKKDSSVDDLLKSFNENRAKRKAELAALLASTSSNNNNDDDGNDSGRSTPDYLKKYSVNYHFNKKKTEEDENVTVDNEANNNNATEDITTTTAQEDSKKRLRTFSETLKMLDEDILADINVK